MIFRRILGKENDYDECISILQRYSLPEYSNISPTPEMVSIVLPSSQSKKSIGNKSLENRSSLTHLPEFSDEALRTGIEREEKIRDGDTGSEISDSSNRTSLFASTDPEEIAIEFVTRVQRHMRGTEADVNLGKNKKCIRIKLDTESSAALKKEGLLLTLLILLPENSYTIDGDVISLPWSALKDKHVRDFKKEFLEQENRLLRLKQNSSTVVAALVAQSVIPAINSEFAATREEAELRHRENIENHEKTQKKQDLAIELLVPPIRSQTPQF
jgi:hypothetical protein